MTFLESLPGAELPYYLAPFLFVLMGIRHGLDSDHIAALSDLVVINKNRSSQIIRGILYASGHSLVVLVMGLLAALLGVKLSATHASWMESAVGVTLITLGGVILISTLKNDEYSYQSKVQILINGLEKLTRWRLFSGKSNTHSKTSGIFLVGVIHGIGAETPTQLALISSSAGLGDTTLVLIQIVLFTAGVLLSTVFLVYALSWGVNRLKRRDSIFRILGWITGGYSIILGVFLITRSALFSS